MRDRFPAVALFDLDGTLLDSAPDMLATVNAMRAARGIAAMPLADIRPHVSRGARAMIGAAFPELNDDGRMAHVREFLDLYAGELGRNSAAFDGVEAMLAALESAGTTWGIVTNKPEALAIKAVRALGWSARCAVLVGGDSLPERKPHPLPLLHAARQLCAEPAQCTYVGDDRRDIEAAIAAGMRSVVALWGYRPEGESAAEWGADTRIATPAELAHPTAWP